MNKTFSLDRYQLIEVFFVVLLMITAATMSATLVQRNPNVTGDGLQYMSVVFNALQGYGYRNLPNMTWLAEPGYGFLVYLLTLIVKDSELGGMLVSLIAYVLLIPAVYLTVRKLGSSLSAAIAAVFCAFYPYLLTFSWLNLTDSVYTFFLFLCFSVYCQILLGEKEWGYALLLGVLLGCTTLIRPEGYGVAVLAFVSLGVVQYIEAKRTNSSDFGVKKVWQAISPTVFSALIFGAIMFSFLLFIHQISGAWVITPKTPYLVPATQPTNASELPLEPTSSEAQLPSSQAGEAELPAATESMQEAPSIAATESPPAKLDVLPLSLDRISKNWLLWLSYFFAMGVQPLFPAFWLGLSYLAVKNRVQRQVKQQRQRQGKRSLRNVGSLPLMNWERPGFWSDDGGSWRDRKILLAIAVFFAIAGVYLTTNLMYRYLLPYMVYVLVLLSLFMGHWISALRLWFAPKNASLFSTICVFLVGIGYFFALSPSGTLLLAQTFSLPQMNSLPQVMNIKHLNLGARAAGIWMRDNLFYSDDVFIAASKNTQNGCYLILYQLFNRQFPIKGRCVSAFSQDEVARFVQAGGDYFILDNDSIVYVPELQPLWNNPDIAPEYGLELVHQDPDGAFQIYQSKLKMGG